MEPRKFLKSSAIEIEAWKKTTLLKGKPKCELHAFVTI